MSKKYVYSFGQGIAKARSPSITLLGNKGAQLAEMSRLKLPIPAGFTCTTKVCKHFLEKDAYPDQFKEQVLRALKRTGRVMGRKFGDPGKPLLVSVRSGSPVSMPGMMDSVLNIGINDEIARGLVKHGGEQFSLDCYRRFIQMYADVVLGLVDENEVNPFETVLAEMRRKQKITSDYQLSIEGLKEIIKRFKATVKKRSGKDFPTDPYEQLWGSIGAIFKSWNLPRAKMYRHDEGVSGDWGTAANVQAMVFGNLGENSGTLVAFTRDPSTGENALYGDFLPNAQGEDVVAGIRQPFSLSKLADLMPEVYQELIHYRQLLEEHYGDIQDFEATIENGKLWMLQTRTGKRTAQAAIRIAVNMMQEGLFGKGEKAELEVLKRIAPEQVEQALHPQIDPRAKAKPIAEGLAASPGAVSGVAVFNADEARSWPGKVNVILVRPETKADDVHGFREAVLTTVGGMTSHAGVVARGRNIPCVVGCHDIDIDPPKKLFRAGRIIIRQGDLFTIDGSTGQVYQGEVPLIEQRLPDEFYKLLKIATKFKHLGVWTNADTPAETKMAYRFGAQGIGLCRTEHMFFKKNRIHLVRLMILSDDEKLTKETLAKLCQMQKRDFVSIFKAANGLPVTIRTLDPPLHEFLQIKTKRGIQKLADQLGISRKKLLERIGNLSEDNPMLGHRGCRLGISRQVITEMQVKAIFTAACSVSSQGIKVLPKVMIPLVGDVNELIHQKEIVTQVAEEVMKQHGIRIVYRVGTMIEIPRACLVADKIAKVADFFSFGTNDLTQMTYAYSRDDAEKGFLPFYFEHKILSANPFQTIDQDGVGELMRICVKRGKKINPDLEIGICGEHGGDPASIFFCHKLGLDYVSCSPWRVPVAIVAAAKAALKKRR
jgi:pyruvate,orthophosphate dikinase